MIINEKLLALNDASHATVTVTRHTLCFILCNGLTKTELEREEVITKVRNDSINCNRRTEGLRKTGCLSISPDVGRNQR